MNAIFCVKFYSESAQFEPDGQWLFISLGCYVSMRTWWLCRGMEIRRRYWSRVTIRHRAVGKTVNRALMLSEKSLTVNGFAYRIHFEHHQTRDQ